MKKQIIEEPKHLSIQETLTKLEESINATYGVPVIVRAGRLELEKIDSGIHGFDYETGGIPRGRWMTIVGDESTFKSTFTYRIGGNFQRICGNCMKGRISEVNFKKCIVPVEPDKENVALKGGENVALKFFADAQKRNVYCPGEKVTHSVPLKLYSYQLECSECSKPEYSIFLLLDAERNYTKVWARKWGVIHFYTAIAEVETTEQIGDIARTYMLGSKTSFIGVDSVDAIGPMEERKESIEKYAPMALQARKWNQITRVLTGLQNKKYAYSYVNRQGSRIAEVRPAETTICKIHQWREKLGMYVGDQRVIGAGRGGKYADSMRIDLSIGEKNYHEPAKGPKTLLGIYFNFYLGKQKTGTPYRKGRFYYNIHAQKVENTRSLVEYGLMHGIVKQAGAWYTIGEDRFQGKDKLYESVERDTNIYLHLVKELNKKKHKTAVDDE